MAYPQQQPQFGGFAPPPPNYDGYPSAPFGQPMGMGMGMPGAGPYGGGVYPQQPGFPQGMGMPGAGVPYGPGGFPQGMGMPPGAGFHFQPPPEPPKPDVRFGGGSNIGGAEMGMGGGEFGFTEKSIRMAFIRKVYSILSIQLIVTVGFIALFVFHEPMKIWSRQNSWFFILALVMVIVLLITMACCEGVRRKSPGNLIILGLFTICEGFLLGASASTYKADEVILAVGMTAVVCLALTAFSFQTKWDFTAHGGILFVAVIILFVFGIVASFLSYKFPILRIIYASIGALIFSAYLVFDTQQMMGGKKYSISPEEYIFAALNLYLDMINIFMYILTIIGYGSDD